ncbi:MAG: LamG domain-containing protein [Candidatus Hydrogenedentes bacterium]|nr:LamG domain-containing protein [Candidatus Hydrogenedentota bacterium]
MPANENLVAHFPLANDANDISRTGLRGDARGVVFREGAAWFDGRGAHIEVPDHEVLHLGTSDFTICASVHSDQILDTVLGDILCKFDPAARKGFNFGLLNYSGVTSSTPNCRNVFFGIDNGALDAEWTDRGRPGNAVCIFCLCVYNDALYAGTFESGKDEKGRVWRYAGERNWEDCGAPYASNAILALAEFDGKLYAAASHYRSRGSSLAESENETPGGRIFRYEGDQMWTEVGALEGHEAIHSLTVYRDKLYASSLYAPPGVYRYDGDNKWTPCGHPGTNPGGRIVPMGVWRGHIWGGSYDGEYNIYRYAGGQQWDDMGKAAEITQTYSFMPYRGELYIGAWPSGAVYRWDGQMGWENAGQLGQEKEVMGMAVYNGKLYGGTLPLAQVYRYDGDGNWYNTGQLDKTPDVVYRRAWTMAIFRGQLFCGTLPSGRVFSIEAGKCATLDKSLSPGWHHLAVTKEGGQINIFVDGALSAQSDEFDHRLFDITNDKPMTIGFGMHDYFNGAMKDVRIYARPLGPDEIRAIAKV